LISRNINNDPSQMFSMLMHIGDIAYSTGYLIKWELYMQVLNEMKIGTNLPIVLNQGNHERDFPHSGAGSNLYPGSHDSGGECGRCTSLRFPSPTNLTYDESGYYSVIHGSSTIIMLNSETKMDSTSPQYQFLEDTLQKVDRNRTPWVIVCSHRPMYYVYYKGGNIDPTFQVIEDLLFTYNVNIFIGAHVHNTFLSYPVYQGLNNDNGIYHMGVGNGGAQLDVVGNSSNTPSWVSFQHYYYNNYYY